MAGFRNVKEYVDACEGGRNWITQFRKAVPGVTNSAWVDMSVGTSGSYPPNYFASSPLVAATLPSNKGISVQQTGGRSYIKDFTILSIAPSATSIGADTVKYVLMDYVLYYPFIDLTSTELQEFDNAVAIPRYTDGRGVRVMMVMQASNGNYAQSNLTMTYVNQDGVQRSITSQLAYMSATTSTIAVSAISGSNNNTYFAPYLPLAAGDTGVRSITSVQLSADWGGLACFVLVKPLLTGFVGQGCRRTTTGNLDSFGAPSQMTNLIHSVNGAWIEDGAYITPVLRFESNPGGGAICGTLETVW